jgi:hypothetical protein
VRTVSDVDGPLVEPLRNHLRSLESIFADPELANLRAKSPRHPAVAQFSEITDYLHHGLPYPDDVEIARSVTSALLDRSIWIAPVGGDPWEMLPDDEAKRQIQNRVRKSDQYNDVMAEVFYWSWLRSKGLPASLVEVEGKPDIYLSLIDYGELWIEVKRIRLGTRVNRVRKDIRKASSQIRRASESGAGAVVISLERAVARAALDDRVPSDVELYIAEAERELASGFSRNVAKVVIFWDDLSIDATVGAGISYRLHRRGVVLNHLNPVTTMGLGDATLGVDITAQLSGPWPQQLGTLTGHGPRLATSEFVVGPSFREFNAGTDGVRPHHALEAASDPDAEYRQTFADGSGKTSIITRRVTAARNPYTLVLMVHDLKDGSREIGDAYKLYHDENGKLSRDALTAFRAFVHLYGAPVGLEIDPGEVIWAKLIMSARVNTSGRDIGLALPADGGNYLTGATAISHHTDPPGFSVAFAYAVDVDKYKADVAKQSRIPRPR